MDPSTFDFLKDFPFTRDRVLSYSHRRYNPRGSSFTYRSTTQAASISTGIGSNATRSYRTRDLLSLSLVDMSPPSENTVQHHTDGSQSYRRDSEFFIDVEPLYLRAETILFCVPRHYFQTSDVFAQMFTPPVLKTVPQEGSSEEHPLFLQNVTADEFREFLRILSSRFTMSNNATNRSNADSWLIVLKLASLWQFRGLREVALKHLKLEDCITRIQVAREYNVNEWFLPGMKDLVARRQPLTGDEINRLGVDFAAKVITLREEARDSGEVRRSGEMLFHGYSQFIKDEVITDKFGGNTGASA